MPQNAATRPASTLLLPSDREIKIDRTFNAPRTLVWRAWTDAKLLPKWMGPARYKMTTSQMDVRTGGTYRWGWDIETGSEMVIHGRFVEVDPPSRMVTQEFMEGFPDPTHNTITFTETAGRTTVSVLIKAPSKEARDAMLATGMKDGMDLGYIRLDGLLDEMAKSVSASGSKLTLPSDTEIVLVRSFAARRELVWRAFTDATLIPKWYGLAAHPMTTCEMDVRPNGRFRWAWEADGVVMFATGGIIRQVEKPRLLVMESMEPDPTPEIRSHTFEESAGRTTVTIRIKVATKAIRDEFLAMDMKAGMDEGHARLDGLLVELAKPPAHAAGSKLTLPSDTEIRLTRTFRAPRAAVFHAWTDPALLPRWMNPPHCQMTKATVDLRVGGKLHYTYTTPRGTMEQGGEFVEVRRPDRLVFTESRGPGQPGWRTTVEFAEAAGTTTVTVTHHMADTKSRDEALASGMDKLWEHAWTQLDGTLAEKA